MKQGVPQKQPFLSLDKSNAQISIHHEASLFPHLPPLSPASSWSLCITSSEEDLRKTTAVTQQTKALISRKPLPLPVVSERGEERGKSDSGPRLLSSLCRLRDKRRDKAQGEIIFRAGPISRAIEERKWGMSLGGLGRSHEGRSILFLAWGLAPWI